MSVPLVEGLRNLESGYSRGFALNYCKDKVWAALEAAQKVSQAYTASAEDWNDGEFALWRKDDLVNALTDLRQAMDA